MNIELKNDISTRNLWQKLTSYEDRGHQGSINVKIDGKTCKLDYYQWMSLNLSLFEFFLCTDLNLRQKTTNH